MVKNGLASYNSLLFRKGQYFGQEMLLTDFSKRHGVLSLTYLDAFRIDREDLFSLFERGQYPRMKVCGSLGLQVTVLFLLQQCMRARAIQSSAMDLRRSLQ